MDEPGSLRGRDVFPLDDAVADDALAGGRQLVERPLVAKAQEGTAFHRLDHGRVLPLRLVKRLLRHDQDLVADLRADVIEVWIDGKRDVRWKSPRRRRPHEERLPLTTLDRKAHEDREMRHLAVAVDHLVLRQRRPASRAPRHRTMALVQPALLLAQLQDVPDVRDVQVVVGEVRVLPVHPLAHPDGVLRDRRGGPIHARAAGVGELRDAVRLDIALAVEVQLALDLHLNPETLAIEAVLVTLIEAAHCLVALVDVLVRARPGVMDPHPLDVRSDRAVDEREARTTRVLLSEHVEGVLAVPEVEDAVVDLHEVELAADRPESRFVARLRHAPLLTQTKSRPDFSGRPSRGTTRVDAACVHSLRR